LCSETICLNCGHGQKAEMLLGSHKDNPHLLAEDRLYLFLREQLVSSDLRPLASLRDSLTSERSFLSRSIPLLAAHPERVVAAGTPQLTPSRQKHLLARGIVGWQYFGNVCRRIFPEQLH